MFKRYVGIDYSGAKAPVSRLAQLQVYSSSIYDKPSRQLPYDKGAKNWCRKEIARYVAEILLEDEPVIVGVDHGFSFPEEYFDENLIDSWDDFLTLFKKKWQTDHDHMYVDFARKKNKLESTTSYRLCEKWTVGAKSVFHFDVQGSVAKSTHAGLPWIAALRDDPKITQRTHFWPFDGFDVPRGKSVIAETYPSLFRRRYPKVTKTDDQHDAYVISSWLRDMDRRGSLKRYFNPPLTLPERTKVLLEGWILGAV